ncbi:MAG: glutamine--tRNA ligase/YqeY domain fusion protein [Caldilineaceae bacterium]|nr:glutamine--tRNA ligase/YqeY domain fusion protein [Caldilineaceae bacterium]
MTAATDAPRVQRDFLRQIVADDVASGRVQSVVTRFPPEPNGYLHIGHAKSICLNFGIAQEFGGRCHLRFDDTNPETEDIEYVRSIMQDIRWLGFNWEPHLYFASDYFEQLYDWAVQLIKDGKAYVDDLNEEEIRAYRGTVTEPGRHSPYRDRSVEENLDLFARMRAGEFGNGAKVLRAKIDMAHPNMKMRDPLMYRIRHANHYRRGDAWHVYPMYDWAHGQSDAIETITHSICTLEFENNRELYDWFLENLGIAPRPHQYEFARLNVEYTITSKRKLLKLVEEGYVSGWDDPRMPTVAAMRRRGYTPASIRNFVNAGGAARVNARTEFELLEYHVRDDLNHLAPRVMCVLEPLKVTITNYPADEVEWLDADLWPRDVPKEATRPVPFARELFIERSDFMEAPPAGFKRLSPGAEVRLRYAYVIKCDEVVKDPATGEVVELRCSYDPATRGGTVSGRKVKGTIHWVAAAQSVPCEVRIYDRLFANANPEDVPEGGSFLDNLNPDSLRIITDARVEHSVAGVAAGERFQFERQGYFVADIVDSRPDAPVFNRIVALRDTWKKNADEEPSSQPATQTSPDAPEEVVVGTVSAERAAARAADADLHARFQRYQQELGLAEGDADMLTGEPAVAAFYEDALAAHDNPKLVANWLIHGLLAARDDQPLADLGVTPAQLGRLAALVDEGAISSNIAADVLAEMLAGGGDPAAIVDAKGLRQVSDAGALQPVIAEVVAANPDKAAAYRNGKDGLIGFFVGQVMRQTGGKANPQLVRELLEAELT